MALNYTTFADLPASVLLLNNPQGNGGHFGAWDQNGRKATCNFKVPIEDLETTLNTINGSPQVFGSGSTATYSRSAGLQYRFYPSLYASRLSYRFEGLDSLVTVTRPNTSAIVTVEFEPLLFDPGSNQPYVTVRVRGSVNVVTIPNFYFTFVGNSEKVEQDFGVKVGQVDLQVTMHRVPDLDAQIAKILPLMGKVNSIDTTLGKTTYLAGYLLFPTFDADEVFGTLGGQEGQFSFNVVYRSQPWNKAMRSDGTWDTLSPAPYSTADLNGLVS